MGIHIGNRTSAHLSPKSKHIYNSIVTINMVSDALDDFELLQLPQHPERTIAWTCTLPADHDAFDTFEKNDVLLIVGASSILEGCLPAELPALVVLGHDEPYDTQASWRINAEKRPVIVVRSLREESVSESLGRALNSIQLLLFKMSRWANQLHDILLSSGSIQDIVDASEEVFDNFIDVTDSTYKLVAFTKNVSPVDPLSTGLLAKGFHSNELVMEAETMGAVEEWLDQRDMEVFGPDDLVPHKYITGILRNDGAYAGHVVMVCNNNDMTPGMLDSFKFLVAQCQELVNQMDWIASPGVVLLNRLISDERISQAYLEEQLASLKMENEHSFQLALIDISDSSCREQIYWLMSVLEERIRQPHYILPYDGYILILFHSEVFNAASIRMREDQINEFCCRMSCIAYLSDEFQRLRDVPRAYEQAQLIKQYKSCIDVELRPLDNIDMRRVMHFDEAFCFYMFDTNTNSKLRDFCMTHTIIDMINDSNDSSSEQDIQLLYFYLFFERKSVPTAQQLNMHRNSVLYRINNLEKKYGLDLDSYSTRERLLTIFRFKILTSSKFRTLLT